MTVTLHSTTKVVQLNDKPARIWEGKTDTGISVHAFIPLIAADEKANQDAFEKGLNSHAAPSAEIEKVYPLKMFI